MQKFIYIFSLLSLVTVFQVENAAGQTTSSPYSSFGLGALEGNSTGPSDAMGGTGIAFMSDRYLNISNPASYTGLDSLLSIFEIGIFGKYTSFSTSTESQSLVNANLKYMLMGFRISRWLSTCFGFTPYSSIGYNINTNASIDGSTQTYVKTYSGNGGVNQILLGGSVKIFKNLSAGVNISYLFGNVTHIESSTVLPYNLKDITYISNFDFNYGLNYHFNVKKFDYLIGLTYSNEQKLRTDNVTTMTTDDGTNTLTDRSYKYKIPESFGIGLAVSKDFFKAGVDFERSMWKGTVLNNSIVRARNTDRISVGVEFPSQGLNKGTTKMIFYRVGVVYRESYFTLYNLPINYYGITFGAGFPLWRTVSILNASLELGTNGTEKNGLFRENYCTLNLDFPLRARWFEKKRYY